MLSSNPKAMSIIKANPDKINWKFLSMNPNAIDILEQNQSMIHWECLSSNIGIFEIDYEILKNRIMPFKEELIQTCLKPEKVERFLYEYNYDIVADEMFI